LLELRVKTELLARLDLLDPSDLKVRKGIEGLLVTTDWLALPELQAPLEPQGQQEKIRVLEFMLQ